MAQTSRLANVQITAVLKKASIWCLCITGLQQIVSVRPVVGGSNTNTGCRQAVSANYERTWEQQGNRVFCSLMIRRGWKVRWDGIEVFFGTGALCEGRVWVSYGWKWEKTRRSSGCSALGDGFSMELIYTFSEWTEDWWTDYKIVGLETLWVGESQTERQKTRKTFAQRLMFHELNGVSVHCFVTEISSLISNENISVLQGGKWILIFMMGFKKMI